MSKLNLIERLFLEEIGGKNRAIHAYDRMLWTVRTGFLTLFFAGWAILLKALVENSSAKPSALDNRVLLVMLLVSVALGIGGL